MSERNVTSVMVIHDQPENFRDMLASRFPDIAFTYVTDLSQLPAQLAAVNPEVVFSLAQPHFPGGPQCIAAAHPSVQWLQVGGSGYEQFLPWPRKDLRASHCAGVLARYLAETVLGGILALNGRFLTYLNQQRQRQWQQHTFLSLSEQTLLIVGLGTIGSHLASFAKALGMRVIATRRHPEPHPAVDKVYPAEQLPQLLAEADVVSLHVRLAADTKHLINRKTLTCFKRGALLVNTSRGGVVDEPALIEALQSGQLGGAYLDVFAQEPLPPESPLWALPNVLITPHVSDSVDNWQMLFADFFAENLERWCHSMDLRNSIRLD